MDDTAARELAERLLQVAGREALRYFRVALEVEDKAPGAAFDPVTAADRAVEASLRRGLAESWPAAGIRGEEYADTPGDGRHEWLIDPIDGTRAFITGMPLWGVLLGLLRDGEPALGFMHQPYLGETFGGNGQEAWLLRAGDRQRLRSRAVATLAEAVLYTTHPESFASPEDAACHARLARQVRLSRFGGDCYSYCMLASGHVQLVVESGLQDYDILPLVPIIEGAGGTVTDWQGRPLRGGGQVLAAADRTLHAQALKVLAAR
ncbi:MAG: histidinol-phosphatase [Gammaproteobacteria bacterium]|nr:histidinol-phosphatase [Gammaproteobacteria bacterium]TVQ47489.1 MAG: histidinol-phosphatase [Gammaproteobacteria bacterium]